MLSVKHNVFVVLLTSKLWSLDYLRPSDHAIYKVKQSHYRSGQTRVPGV